MLDDDGDPPGLWTITIISASFFGNSMIMVQEREAGTFRRYLVTPVNSATVVAAYGIVGSVTLCLSLLLQGVAAWTVFGVDCRGPVWALPIVLLVGILAFAPLGLLVGSIARDLKTAPVLTNLLFFPLMFLSGAAIPFFMLPHFVQVGAKLLPSTYVVESLTGVMVRGESLGAQTAPLLILLATGAFGVWLNALLFRWESTQPLSRQRLGLALLGLLLLYGIAALVGPTLRMVSPPDKSTSALSVTTKAAASGSSSASDYGAARPTPSVAAATSRSESRSAA
ncbi:MAG: ABC transporter permease [Candidatus Eisenbacteria bacterium]